MTTPPVSFSCPRPQEIRQHVRLKNPALWHRKMTLPACQLPQARQQRQLHPPSPVRQLWKITKCYCSRPLRPRHRLRHKRPPCRVNSRSATTADRVAGSTSRQWATPQLTADQTPQTVGNPPATSQPTRHTPGKSTSPARDARPKVSQQSSSSSSGTGSRKTRSKAQPSTHTNTRLTNLHAAWHSTQK